MKIKELELVKDFLELASERISNQCCNDWEFPETWTEKEKRTFVRQYHEWNGDPEEYYDYNLRLSDFAVASFLAFKCENLIIKRG